MAIRPESHSKVISSLSSSNKKTQRYFKCFQPSRKRQEMDSTNNNIVIPSFYKNTIFTSLCETSLLSLDSVHGDNRGMNECVSVIITRTIKWWFCFMSSPYLWFVFTHQHILKKDVSYIHFALLESTYLGRKQKSEYEEEETVFTSQLEVFCVDWQVQAETPTVREELKVYLRCNTGEGKHTGNTAHIFPSN